MDDPDPFVRSFGSEADQNINEDSIVEEIGDKRFVPIFVISSCWGDKSDGIGSSKSAQGLKRHNLKN